MGLCTQQCCHEHCETGWLHLFRSRSAPVFEGRWGCTPRCMEAIIADLVRHRVEGWDPGRGARSLRMPLGLILLNRGWITRQELRSALEAQSLAGRGRIGEWLQRLNGISSSTIAKGLAIQWNCAALLSGVPGIEPVPVLMPAYLQKRYGLVLLRQGQEGGFYLAAPHRADYAACRAAEHMLAARVEPAFLEDSAWKDLPDDEGTVGPLQPGQDGAAAQICALVEQRRPVDARLVRFHDHLWLRMWLSHGRRIEVEDTVLSLRTESIMSPAASLRAT